MSEASTNGEDGRSNSRPSPDARTAASGRTMSFKTLTQVVESTPVPTTPVVHLRHVEERGLTLLELTTKLSHVVRQSEQLMLMDRSHLRRSLTVDIDLSTLTERHFRALSRHEPNISPQDSQTEFRTSQLWVPIANQSRTDLASIIVRGSNGQILPRMASDEVKSAFTGAMVRLFRMLIDSSPTVISRTDPLYKLQHDSHRSRWLIESAIRRLVTEGQTSDLSLYSDMDYSEISQIRKTAIDALEVMASGQIRSFAAFIDLLNFTASNYPLAVLLPVSDSLVTLQFDAPAISAEPFTPGISFLRKIGQVTSPVRVFPASYETSVSRGTASYHVILNVDEQLKVRRFVASTDADEPLVQQLRDDMRGVAARFKSLQDAGPKLLENELQSIAERLAVLGRRRVHEADAYRRHLTRSGSDTSDRRSCANYALGHLLDNLARTRSRPLAYLEEFSSRFFEGQLTVLTKVFTPARLEKLSQKIHDLELGRDLLVDNDPREHGGHVYWHQRAFTSAERALDPITVRLQAVLADDPPSLGGSVSRMLVAVQVVLIALFCILFDGAFWLIPWEKNSVPAPQADAIVTTLLLVPGLLLTRLVIPSSNSVVGQIRSQNRVVAYVTFAVPAAVALYISAESRVSSLVPASGVYVLAGLFLANLLGDGFTRRDNKQTAGRSSSTPEWVRQEFDEQLTSRLAPRVVRFNAKGRS